MAIKKNQVSPIPINEAIVDSSRRPTQALVRYLQDLRKVTTKNEDITAINNIIIACGLDEDGNYIPSEISNYIDTALSLYEADLLLDSAIFNNMRELVIKTSTSVSLSVSSQTILCNAVGAIEITLPSPANCFSDSRSLRIAIHKIDTSSNTITILPNNSELVVGETTQTLELDGEILNLITDGTNWYLGA